MLRAIAAAIRAALRGLASVAIGFAAGLTGWRPEEPDVFDELLQDREERAEDDKWHTPEGTVFRYAMATLVDGAEMPDLERHLSLDQRIWLGRLESLDCKVLTHYSLPEIRRHLYPQRPVDNIRGVLRIDGAGRSLQTYRQWQREQPQMESEGKSQGGGNKAKAEFIASVLESLTDTPSAAPRPR